MAKRGILTFWAVALLASCGGRSERHGQASSDGGASAGTSSGGGGTMPHGGNGIAGRSNAGQPSAGIAPDGGVPSNSNPGSAGMGGAEPAACGKLHAACCKDEDHPACPQTTTCIGGTCESCGFQADACCVEGVECFGEGNYCIDGICLSMPNLPSLTGQPSSFGNNGWASSFFLAGCKAKDGPFCVNASPCPQGGLTTVERFPIGGIPGRHYKASLVFDGIATPKTYQGGTRDEPNIAPDYRYFSDTFYRDGEPSDSDYEVWQLAVFDDQGVEQRHFFMNSVPAGFEAPRSLLVAYFKLIVVVGGGYIEHTVHDPDCRVLDNCGPGEHSGSDCPAPTQVPNESILTEVPAKYQDPVTQTIVETDTLNAFADGLKQPWHAALGHVRVNVVEQTDDPVSWNYVN